MGESRSIYRVLVGKPEEKRLLGRPSIVRRIILRWIFRKQNVGYGLDRAGECGNEPLDSIRSGEFLD
jgi:hypothetical protein